MNNIYNIGNSITNEGGNNILKNLKEKNAITLIGATHTSTQLLTITTIIFLCIFLIFNNKTKIFKNIANDNNNQFSMSDVLISYTIVDNQDLENIKILISIKSDTGIEYIIKPDNTRIDINKKNKIALDYLIPIDVQKKFKIKLDGSDEIEKTIEVNTDMINSLSTIEYATTTDGSYFDQCTIQYNTGLERDGDKIFYKTSEANPDWVELNNGNTANLMLLNEDTIQLKKVDVSGNIVYTEHQIDRKSSFFLYSSDGVQEFTANEDSTYILEVWGAQGGTYEGGRGGYSRGTINLRKGDSLYICVGRSRWCVRWSKWF